MCTLLLFEVDRSVDRSVDVEIYRAIDRAIDREKDRETDRETDRKTDKETDKETDRAIDRYRYRSRSAACVLTEAQGVELEVTGDGVRIVDAGEKRGERGNDRDTIETR